MLFRGDLRKYTKQTNKQTNKLTNKQKTKTNSYEFDKDVLHFIDDEENAHSITLKKKKTLF